MKLQTGRVYAGIFASSADPAQLSTTVDGIVTVLSSLLTLAPLVGLHINLNQADLSTAAASVIAIFGAVMTIRGIVLKVINSFATTPATPATGNYR